MRIARRFHRWRKHWKLAKTRPPDLQSFIVSYPKSGRTWLRVMLGRALCDVYRLPESLIFDLVSLTRLAGLPRAGFWHDNADLWGGRSHRDLPTDKTAFRDKKVLLLVRDPRDLLVSSYFHATRRIDAFDGSISDFVRDGRFGIRKILTFHNIWHANRHVPEEFDVVRYEDMHRSPHLTLKRVLDFVGVPLIGDDVVAQALQYASFTNMQGMERRQSVATTMLRPGQVADIESYKVRRGKVGGFFNYLGDEDIRYIDAAVAELGYPFPWHGGDAADDRAVAS